MHDREFEMPILRVDEYFLYLIPPILTIEREMVSGSRSYNWSLTKLASITDRRKVGCKKCFTTILGIALAIYQAIPEIV